MPTQAVERYSLKDTALQFGSISFEGNWTIPEKFGKNNVSSSQPTTGHPASWSVALGAEQSTEIKIWYRPYGDPRILVDVGSAGATSRAHSLDLPAPPCPDL